VTAFWGFAGFFTVIAAWFALVATARYPQGLFRFNSGVLRAIARSTAYTYLLADPFPPLGTQENPEYPVRLEIGPPQERYSRLKVLFRGLLAIPVYIVAQVFNYAIQAVSFVCWLVIVVLGRIPFGLHEALEFLVGFNTRVAVYAFGLLTDVYPPFRDPGPSEPDDLGAAPTYGQPPASNVGGGIELDKAELKGT
jgi:hypothetical protein